jgi:hypothetical protein
MAENVAKSSTETKTTTIKLSRISLIPTRLDVILSKIDCFSFLSPHITIKTYTITISSILMTGKLGLSLSLSLSLKLKTTC